VLEALLKPIETEEDDSRVDGDWVREHRPEIKHDLLESVEQVNVDRIESCLCAGAAGKEERIDVLDVSSASSKYKDRPKDNKTNDVEI
jgi:hypothetical protein